MRRRDPHRGRGIARFEDDVAVLLEHLADDAPENALVLDQEDRLPPRRDRIRRRHAVRGDGPRLEARQVDCEARPFPELARDGDPPAELLHDPVHRRQPEARSPCPLPWS